MITIDRNTRIATLLRQHAGALDAIVSISPKFEKLRNPLLRKLMAGRTSLSMAARVGGCSEDDFFRALEPLGFCVSRSADTATRDQQPLPKELENLQPDQVVDLDVRPILAAGEDPLAIIMKAVQQTLPNKILRIINSFEPTPLILLLQRKGFKVYVNKYQEECFHTWVYASILPLNQPASDDNEVIQGNWDELQRRFDGRMTEVDVRGLVAPHPMITILQILEELPLNNALFVFHKRLPMYLLPEFKERGFVLSYKDNGEGDVRLLIYKKSYAAGQH